MSPSATDSPFSPYHPSGKLHGFICILTSSLPPISLAIAHELAIHSCACIYACVPDEPSLSSPILKELIEDLEKVSPRTKVIGYPLRMSDEGATLQLIDDVLNAWGRLDIWVSCPSSTSPTKNHKPTTLAETTPSTILSTFSEQALAPFLALKYAPPAMGKLLEEQRNYPNASRKDRPYGSIILVGSTASTLGGSPPGVGGPAETMAAHAALGVVRSGVEALRGVTGLRVNYISVGEVGEEDEEREGELGKPSAGGGEGGGEGEGKGPGERKKGTPTEVARVVGFLASAFSAFVNGSNIVVDGGATAIGGGAGAMRV